MDPDYAEALFWDEEMCNIGGWDCLFIGETGNSVEVDLSGDTVSLSVSKKGY